MHKVTQKMVGADRERDTETGLLVDRRSDDGDAAVCVVMGESVRVCGACSQKSTFILIRVLVFVFVVCLGGGEKEDTVCVECVCSCVCGR